MLFAVLFSAGLLLIRISPLSSRDAGELAAQFAEGRDQALFIATAYLLPFAAVMFLWFIAVIRDQLGEREDKFFGTVFFGSGILFVGLILAASAVAASVAVGVRFLELPVPTLEQVQSARAIAYTMLFVISTRAAAVCLISISTLGIRSGVFPRWFAATGYILGLSLLLFVSLWDLFLLALPVWVAAVSLFILRRERDRARRLRRPLDAAR
jgi:hypothetical protein